MFLYRGVKMLKFFSKSKTGQCLSNFSLHPVELNGVIYPTGEHAFHGEKFKFIASKVSCETKKQYILEHSIKFHDNSIDSPKNAKVMGGKKGCKLDPQDMHEWNSWKSEEIQKQICIYKLTHYESVKNTLLSYDQFLHQDNRASPKTIWGGRIKDDTLIGQNKLGIIWFTIKQQQLS
tara:strand:+ start:1013 stop:1543 length:531 start_codon:yes stop_codon:yes gene_type:complete